MRYSQNHEQARIGELIEAQLLLAMITPDPVRKKKLKEEAKDLMYERIKASDRFKMMSKIEKD